jgi:rhodanese-related sulfurtransferase
MDRLLEYASHHPWLVVAAIAVALVVIAFEVRARQQDFAAISPQDAIRLMNQGAMLLDLRKAEDFAAGHIAGARRMDSAEILKAGETLRKQKEKPLIVCCESGSLGASAARILASQGFTKAVNLRGGIAAWRAENLPLAKAAASPGGKADGKPA